MRLAGYIVACLALTVFPVAAGKLEIDFGTYIAFTVDGDFLIVGADSRRVTTIIEGNLRNVIVRDDECKIRILSDHAAFAVAGSGNERINDNKVFDAGAVAANAYDSTGGNILGASERWAQQVSAAIIANPIMPWLATTGTFFGFATDGRGFGRIVRIEHDGSYGAPQDIFGSPNDAYIMHIGEDDLTREILQSNEAAAIRNNQAVSRMTRTGILIHFLVQGIIERKNAAGNSDIGGEAAVLALSRGEAANWQYPTAPCNGTGK
jgi:hypothetical protein